MHEIKPRSVAMRAMFTALVLLAPLGCDQHDHQALGEQKGDTTIRGQRVSARTEARAEKAHALGAAVDRLVAARCDRQESCGEVGARKSYPDPIACRSKVQEDWHEDLNLLACPGGVDEGALDACVGAIGKQACGVALPRVSQLDTCRPSAICKSR